MKKQNNYKKKSIPFLLSAICTASIISSADDIEIYMGTTDTDSSVNIIFMLDTSGSMGYTDGTSSTRMQKAKDGLKEVISGLPGDMRVGLGRFNDPAGSILYPARALDEEILTDVKKKISSLDDDAYEKASTETLIYTDELLFEPNLKTVSRLITSDYDDAEECYGGGDFYVTNQYASISKDGSNCREVNAFIFRDFDIPQGSTIDSAQMRLSTYTASYNVSAKVYAEKSSNPLYYYDTSGRRIEARDYYSANEEWFLYPSYYYNHNYSSDLSNVVQNVINRSDWDENDNGIALRLASEYPLYSNTYFTRSVNSSNYYPQLTINYRDNGSQNKLGLRFESINAASGAYVHKGLLRLVASQNNGSGKIKISTQTGQEPLSFKEENGDISSRALDSVSLELTYDNWNAGEDRLFDVSSLLQNKFNESAWCGGSDIAFIIESPDANAIYALDHSAEYAPELVMQYNGGTENSCKSYDIVNQVSDFEDDSYQDPKNAKNYPYKNTIVTKESGYSGYIFRETRIPPNATIKSAHFHLVATNGNSTSDNYRLSTYVNKPNSYPIDEYKSSKYHISDKISTSLGGITWSIGTDVYKDNTYTSPDLKSYVQSVVNSSAYSSADSDDRGFEIILRGEQDDFKAYSYDDNPGKAAKLVIEYEGSELTNTFSSRSKNIKSSYSDEDSNMTVRQYLLTLIDEQPAKGGTPMEGSLYESGKYFAGEDVNYGRSRNVSQTSSSHINSQRISGSETYENGTVYYPSGCSSDNLDDSDCQNEYIAGSPTYISPMTDNVCESNNVILITDGYPNSQSNYSTAYRDYFNIPLATLIQSETGVYCNDNWSCAETWVSYMYNKDYQDDKTGKNNIFTHIIGFTELDSSGKLKNLASLGGGMFAPASNTSELVKALNLVIASIMEIESTLATPGVAVNQNNRTQHLSDVYYSVFQPSVSKSWYGNLKKYNIDENTETIVDKFGSDAVDATTGFFADGTTSYWSTSEDGGIVEKGGAGSLLSYPRKALTYTSSSEPSNIDLLHDDHRLESDNNKLTKSLFGLSDSDISNDEFDKLRDWLGGKDVLDEDIDGSYTDSRKFMGDPLHSRPVLINYNETTDIVYVSTNEGFLHATNADTGETIFSFMPQELLPNAYENYMGGTGNHIYGLDSSWIAWRHDSNKDGKIVESDGDKVYIYSGMRRGGKNFYALDVTNPESPRLLFVKKPETGGIFQDMGQSWSEPVLGRVRINSVDKVVLIFAGGYDQAYDNTDYNDYNDAEGNQLFMLDASTGQLLWSASGLTSSAYYKVDGMNYSITSKPTIVDLKGDGYIDTLYLTDLGGQILKFKFDKTNNGISTLATGKVIAKLGKSSGDLTKSNIRMFYDSIAVAPIKDGTEKFMAIVAGTGYRAHPLDISRHDIITMFKDKEDFYDTQEIINTPIMLSDLADLTSTLDENEIDVAMDGKNGYYIKLQESNGDYIGEKITGEPLIYDNQIFINSYIPDKNRSECMPVIGYSRGYRMNLTDATPTSDRNDDSTITTEDRYEDKLTSGIANGSKIIYTENGVLLLTNTKVEKIGSGGDMGMSKRRWYRELD